MSWNINGVKQKFDDENVKNLFDKHDILIMIETHFMKRVKAPENFEIIGRSPPSNASRGGVAVYKKSSLDISFHVFTDLASDMVVFSPVESKTLFIALYITPDNSKYKNPEIFSNIDFILNVYKDYQIFIIGDLNSRCGTPIAPNVQYAPNPDTVINTHGRKLNQT